MQDQLVEKIYFSVPVDSFKFLALLTRDEIVPIVDEHILKLSLICDGVTFETIKAFFNFTTPELTMTVKKLEANGLVKIWGDKVVLTPNCRAQFDRGHGKPLSLMKFEEKSFTVTFELDDMKYLGWQRSYPKVEGFHLEIKSDEKNAKKKLKEAEVSFVNNFFAIFHGAYGSFEKVRDIKLYAIKDVVFGKSDKISCYLEFFLSPSNNSLRSQFSSQFYEVASCPRASQDLMTQKLVEKLFQYKKEQSNKNIKEFLSFLNAPHSFLFQDFTDIFTTIENWKRSFNKDKEFFSVIGSLYLQSKEFQSEIKKRIQRKFKDAVPLENKINIIWKVSEKNKIWGSGGQPERFIESIVPHEMLGSLKLFVISESTREENKVRFSSSLDIFKNIISFSSASANNLLAFEEVEMFFIPDCFCVFLFHYSEKAMEEVLLPFGIGTFDKEFMKKALESLKTYIGPIPREVSVAEYNPRSNPGRYPCIRNFSSHLKIINLDLFGVVSSRRKKN